MYSKIEILNSDSEESSLASGKEKPKQIWQTPTFELLNKNNAIQSGTIIGPEGSGTFYVS